MNQLYNVPGVREMLAESWDDGSFWNSNTVASDLARTVLLQEALQEFVIPLLPLQNFACTFNNVPLDGTDKVGVSMFPLQSAGQNQSWNTAVGYATFAGTTSNILELRVGGSGTSSGSSAPAGTACDRKFIGMQFDSYTLRRMPFFSASQLFKQNANRLAVDVWSDIMSRTLTAGNFGAALWTGGPAGFDSDAITTFLYAEATRRNWPIRNRTLMIDHGSFAQSLLRDPALKQFLSYGSTDPIRKAKLEEVCGFNIEVINNLASYFTDNTFGFIAHENALIVATSPVLPAEEVRELLETYEIITDVKSGLSFEYRKFANAQLDQANEVVEVSYGSAAGVQSALARLTTA